MAEHHFHGWPNSSYGTFRKELARSIASSARTASTAPAPVKDEPSTADTPCVGGGCIGYALLSDVPIWYELAAGRTGFPPDLYMDDKRTPYREVE
ncbi:MAG: hypothetical protein IPG92_00010 [Flavobacteriales bacterium]|nr:hypothetical protein [Flavobacteriales bacterium]